MTDNDKNMRTLVVCFVLALAVLVPLKALEGPVTLMREAEVLGEEVREEGTQMELIYSDEDPSEVILPDAEIPPEDYFLIERE